MSDKSAIQWTDATWNPVRGCVKVSPGCAHCYAETFAERFRGVPGHPYEQGFDVRLVPEKLAEPLSWKKPRRVFVNSMSDLFQDSVPDAFIFEVFDVMRRASKHTFQVLTKRPARMGDFLNTVYPRLAVARDANWPRFSRWPLPNVWLGVSVENQHFADERIPLLLQTPAAVRFISAEPLLEDVRIVPYLGYGVDLVTRIQNTHRPLDWVIVGGESGPQSRPFDIAWARSIVAQCQANRVACFVKQLGAVPVMTDAEWRAMHPTPLLSARNHRKVRADVVLLAFTSHKGGDMAEWPEDLQVRQFPEARRVG